MNQTNLYMRNVTKVGFFMLIFCCLLLIGVFLLINLLCWVSFLDRQFFCLGWLGLD